MDKRQDHVEARCYRLVEPENAVNFLRPIMLTGDAVPGNTARHADRLTLAEQRFAAPKPLLGLPAIFDIEGGAIPLVDVPMVIEPGRADSANPTVSGLRSADAAFVHSIVTPASVRVPIVTEPLAIVRMD